MTVNGKVDSRSLLGFFDRQAAASPAARASDHVLSTLVELIEQELGRAIGPDGNFFESGGDSIKALLVAERAGRAGLQVTAGALMRLQTARALAAGLDNPPSAAPLSGETDRPAAMQRWFVDQAQPVPAHWNMSMMLELDPAIDANHLRTALDVLVARHDALRTRLVADADGLRRVVDATAEMRLATDPLVEDAAQLAAFVIDLQSSLSLAHAPLAAAGFLPRRHQLVLCVHHLAVDTTSLAILARDLDVVLSEIAHGNANPTWDVAPSWARWIDDQVAWTHEPAAREAAREWIREIAGAAPRDAARLRPATYEDFRTVRASWPLQGEAAARSDVLEPCVLAALGVALARVLPPVTAGRGDAPVLVWREHQGRVLLGDPARESQAVGWHTAMHPVVLSAHPGAPRPLLPSPARAASYMPLATWLGADGPPRPDASAIGFNFLGDPGQALRTDSLRTVRAIDTALPAAAALANRPPMALQLTAWRQGGEVVVEVAHADRAEARGLALRLLEEARTAFASSSAEASGPDLSAARLGDGDYEAILGLLSQRE